MKKLLSTVTLLLILTSTTAQSSDTLGISEGDTFDFVLEKYLFQLGSETKTTAEFEDDFTSDQNLILHIGEAFTIKILDTSPEGSYDDSAILVEYIASGNSITMYDYVGFGDFFSYTNWDEIKQNISGEFPPHNNYTLLDTASEFGFVWEYSSTYSDATLSETESGILEVRYDRTTGAINYYYNLHNEVEVYDDGSLAFLGEVLIKRVGYGENSDTSPAYGLHFLTFSLIFAISIIRKMGRNNRDRL